MTVRLESYSHITQIFQKQDKIGRNSWTSFTAE